MIPASFLSYTNLNGLHSNMKLFCPGDGDGFLAALTVRTRQVISKYDSPIRVQLCSAGILVFLWKPGAFMDENKRKTDQNDQMGCHVGQHPGLALVLSKSIKV